MDPQTSHSRLPYTPCGAAGGAQVRGPARSFDLRRWFSVASLVALVPAAAATGALMSHFIAEQALQRDAHLTAQLVQNSIRVESGHVGGITLSPYLDARVDPGAAGLDPEAVAHARAEVFEYLETLPDALLINVYAPDRMIVWSTSKSLVGTFSREDRELTEAFESRLEVVRHRSADISVRHDAHFRSPPDDFFVENYVPVKNSAGEVVGVVEVYKEPGGLMPAVRKVQFLAWTITILGGLIVYLGLFGIMRRGSTLLRQQQQQLLEAQSQVFAGEMATALAHSLRNPLSRVRTSAELALCSADTLVRKNAQDIITQVDFLSQWIRELLVYSRPASGEAEPVELLPVVDSVLASFSSAFDRVGIRVVREHEGPARTLVRSSTSLVRQAVHSVVSNAVEAMPAGGEMKVEVRSTAAPPGVNLTISDTGVGMSTEQVASAFRPFYTTKAHGLGVGLPMLRRAMERFGGFVTMSSLENAGTQVRLHFRT
jgi:two-component system, NtrC family, sensor histidine kinase HydH